MNRRLSLLVAAALAFLSSSSRPAAVALHAGRPVAATSQAAIATANPFFAASTLPFQAPPFDRIKDADYQPAIEEGMKRQRAEIEAIADDPAAPTFANTIEAMERTGDLLTRASKVFFNLTQSNTNDTLQKIETEEAPKLAAHQDAIYMNPKLFARVKTIYDTRASLHLAPEAAFFVERYYRNFVRAGALLGDADKATLRALNEEESKLTTDFRQRVLADTDASAVVVDDKAQLAGLSDEDVAAAAEAAKDRKLDGKWLLRLENTTQQPILDRLQNRALRTRVFQASVQRGNHGGPNDTKAITERLAQLRAQKANLLGFANYAAYSLDDQMAKTPQAAEKLMTELVPAATAKAREEAAKMQTIIDRDEGRIQARDPRTGSSTPRRCARPTTISTSHRSSRTSSSTACSRTASSTPPTRCTASPSRSATTSPSTTRTSASSKSSTPTARRWRSSTATTSHARTRAAARGWTASSTRAACSARSPSSSTC